MLLTPQAAAQAQEGQEQEAPSAAPADARQQAAVELLGFAGAALASMRTETQATAAGEERSEMLAMIERSVDLAACLLGPLPADDSLARYRGLYGEALVREAGVDDTARRAALERRLARDIRDGTLDGACAMGVRELLYARTRARLAITRPDHPSAARPELATSEHRR